VEIAGGAIAPHQRNPVTCRPALTDDRGRKFSQRARIEFGAQRDDAFDALGERERSARKRSVCLPDRLQY